MTFNEIKIWLIAKGWSEVDEADFCFPPIEAYHYRQVFASPADLETRMFVCFRYEDLVVWSKQKGKRTKRWFSVFPSGVQIRNGSLKGLGFQP